jgi:hypothetical protein
MPENTVYVGRGSKWGNPFIIGDALSITARHPLPSTKIREHIGGVIDPHMAVDLFKFFLGYRTANASDGIFKMPWGNDIRDGLAGKNLACWCPLGQPCHADVLLEIANQEAP